MPAQQRSVREAELVPGALVVATVTAVVVAVVVVVVVVVVPAGGLPAHTTEPYVQLAMRLQPPTLHGLSN